MSSSNVPSDNSKPVVRDKNPHNYRTVGYSMIVISVSLSLIGLLVWELGDNYHFGSNLMAGQEVDGMTPKKSFNIILFDHSQPIGAKLKLLGSADSIADAQKLRLQYKNQISSQGGDILIFGTTHDDNQNLVAVAEIADFTPTTGYNILQFNDPLPVGAKLTMTKHDDLSANATSDQQYVEANNKDPNVKYVIFSTSFNDNLKLVAGSNMAALEASAATGNMDIVTSSPPSGNANQSGKTATNQTIVVSKKLNTNSTTNGNVAIMPATSNTITTTGVNKTLAVTDKVGINGTNSGK